MPPYQSPSRPPSATEGRTLFPGSGATLRGPTLSSESKNGGGGKGLKCLSMIFFIATSISFWMTIINLQRAAGYNHVTPDAPSTSTQQQQQQQQQSSSSLIDNKMVLSLLKAPIGSLGPKGTSRQHNRYYDSLFYTAMQYGVTAKTSIEVGCASDPFLQYLDWIEHRTCVAPYFVEYSSSSKNDKLSTTTNATIERVTADFMEYKLPNNTRYDLLLCSQVVEHVPDPASFMKKLILSAKTSIISVPFNWPDCGSQCNHVTHHITKELLLKWSFPYVPIYSGVVGENSGKRDFDRRIILVFKNDDIKDGKEGEEGGVKESLSELNIKQNLAKERERL